MTTPILATQEIAEGVVNQAALHNTAIRQMEARLVRALSKSTTTPAVGAAEGDSYIIPAGATGVWSGKTNQIASWIGGAWSYYAPIEGVRLWVNDLNEVYAYDGATWVSQAAGAAPLQCIPIACSDEVTNLTTGVAKVTFRMPFAFTLTAVRASLTTGQTSGSIFTVDINEGGASILSTKLTIDNAEKTSTTAAAAAVISDTALADDAEITIDIDQIGDGTAEGLKVYLIGRPT